MTVFEILQWEVADVQFIKDKGVLKESMCKLSYFSLDTYFGIFLNFKTGHI